MVREGCKALAHFGKPGCGGGARTWTPRCAAMTSPCIPSFVRSADVLESSENAAIADFRVSAITQRWTMPWPQKTDMRKRKAFQAFRRVFALIWYFHVTTIEIRILVTARKSCEKSAPIPKQESDGKWRTCSMIYCTECECASANTAQPCAKLNLTASIPSPF